MTPQEALRDIKRYLDTYDRLRRNYAKAIGCPNAYPPGGIGDGMPRGGLSHADAKRMTELISALRDEMDKLEEDLSYCKRVLEPIITALPPGTERVLLTNRYVRWLSMAETAAATGYAKKSVYEAMRRAEEKIQCLDKSMTRYDSL